MSCTWWHSMVVGCNWVLGVVVVGSLSFRWLDGVVVAKGVLWVC